MTVPREYQPAAMSNSRPSQAPPGDYAGEQLRENRHHGPDAARDGDDDGGDDVGDSDNGNCPGPNDYTLPCFWPDCPQSQ